jgi:hypothetical protein
LTANILSQLGGYVGDFTAAIIAISVLFVLFLIGRELVCWYFKINKTVELLEEIRDLLKSKS